MQRIVRWNAGLTNRDWHFAGNSSNDLDYGYVSYLDVTAEDLAMVSPELRRALTRNGRLGKIVQHTHSVVGAGRIFTFVVDFD
ncbi:hypothetical protein [Actinokineospora sp. UTMC 2448]|uniref:hypothetical protein n=1 Tax=Actinokineospora sp. UTMC 2448 TaxID=2268449 RepID=UPI0021645AB8|nr:hypothetical protein [Actinokineospora sp. UTMC 2448]UVS80562.1 hypothetical protein Actkin_04313 [Actinokineospora sp. UTMC 2448]